MKWIYAIVLAGIVSLLWFVNSLSIKELTYREEINQYDTLSISFQLSRSYSNPFDPGKISVTGVFMTPGNRTIQVPGFWYQNYTRIRRENREVLFSHDDPKWMVRFTPDEPGNYTFRITAGDRLGQATTQFLGFESLPAHSAGFVRQADSARFIFDDNTSFVPVGQNLAWVTQSVTYDYDYYFKRMSDNGMNTARIIMAPWNLAIEWSNDRSYGTNRGFHGIGYYNLENAWKLDHILDQAEQHGIYIILCFDIYGTLRTHSGDPREMLWPYSPYNIAQGGFLETPGGYMTDERAIALNERRLRYIMARWSHSKSILSWELFNELDITDGFNTADALAWTNASMLHIRSIDPYSHLATVSFAEPNRMGQFWALSDFISAHRHNLDVADTIPGLVRNLSRLGKPVLISEFGLGNSSRYEIQDTGGSNLHRAIWSSVFSGAAGSAMPWWWDEYIEPLDMYYHFSILASFLNSPHGLQTMPINCSCPDGIRAYSLAANGTIYIWVENTNNTWNSPDGSAVSGVTLKTVIAGNKIYKADVWDTYTGESEQLDMAIIAGRITVPEFQKDTAIKIYNGAKSS
ncbi:MAG: DUF5060 domain-containing protein [archaeon]